MEFTPYLMNKNLPFTTKTKMADVIHLDYRLIPIIGRFGIEYGFGNKTVTKVCKDNNINVWFFLEIINSYHNHEYFPEKQLQNFDVQLIISYLSSTHEYYLSNKIPEIQSYIIEMGKKVPQAFIKNIKLLNDFFKGYQKELKEHLLKEDNLVFPYVLALGQALNTKKITDELLYKIQNEPIEKYGRNHDNIELKLSDLKNLIIKFLPPILCKEVCQKLLTELFQLESDLENHARIEDKVLVPKVKLIEKKLLEYCGTK